MKIKLSKWLLGQCHREDSVGELARRWVSESAGDKSSDCEQWLSVLEHDADWSITARVVNKEYAIALDFLSRGKSAPTFPKHFASEKYDQMLTASVAKHRSQPELSADAYLRRKHFGLQKALESRTLIYLDTNHWVNLRHVFLGSRHAQDVYSNILASLNTCVKQGSVLCPVSFPLFMELMKQTDQETRLATAQLMDAFSGGVCTQFPYELEKLELRQRLLRTVLGNDAPDLKEWIWTKVGYVAGEFMPFNNAFSDSDNNFIRKVSIDGMWSLSLEHFLELDPTALRDDLERKLAEATNADATWYREAKLPFQEVYTREKAYLVRRLMAEMNQIIQEIWNDYPDHRDLSKRTKTNSEGFDLMALASLQVRAGINAALLVSSKKFSTNDVWDFQHAALAVPYYDALFCDGPMAHVLRSKPLEFDKVYETTVLSRPDQILQFLSTLEQNPTRHRPNQDEDMA